MTQGTVSQWLSVAELDLAALCCPSHYSTLGIKDVGGQVFQSPLDSLSFTGLLLSIPRLTFHPCIRVVTLWYYLEICF